MKTHELNFYVEILLKVFTAEVLELMYLIESIALTSSKITFMSHGSNPVSILSFGQNYTT